MQRTFLLACVEYRNPFTLSLTRLHYALGVPDAWVRYVFSHSLSHSDVGVYVVYIHSHCLIQESGVHIHPHLYTLTHSLPHELDVGVSTTEKIGLKSIDWFWLQGWLINKGAPCTRSAPLFRIFISLFQTHEQDCYEKSAVKISLLRLPKFQQVFTGIPVHIKHVFLGVPKFQTGFQHE